MNKLIIVASCLLAVLLSVSASPIDTLPQCVEHEIFLECGTSCPEHCPAFNERTGHLETQSMICNRMCNRGCFCAHGFVKDLKRGGLCVERALCSAP